MSDEKEIIRFACASDAKAICEIYGVVVEQTVISFEFVTPSVEQMQQRMASIQSQFPWLVYERGGEVLGYVYACPHSERAAYLWSTNVSAYIREDARGQRLGRKLYGSLFEILRLQGYINAYAGVTLPNPRSVGLHEAMGFRTVGIYQNVGYKFGAWHDVGWWQLALAPHPSAPIPPKAVSECSTRPGFQDALLKGLMAW